MVHHRLGQANEARDWLTKSDFRSKAESQQALGRTSLVVPMGDPQWWRDWLVFQILRREAHELIDGSPLPDDPWQRLLRGRAYAHLGLKEKAERDFEAAIASNPK